MTNLSLKFEAKQNQSLTPRLQYAVRLLQLSSLDYEQELQDVVGKNPFLESDESMPYASNSPGVWGDATLSAPVEAVSTQPASQDAAHDSEHDTVERDNWLQSSVGTRDGANDSQASATDLMAADVGLRAQLRTQVNVLPLTSRDHTLVCAIIESLDDDGYLRTELSEIAALVDLDEVADDCEMSTALKLVQSFEPAGVGARSVSECLLLQVESLEHQHRELAVRIINDHLERLAHGDVTAMAKALGRSASEVDIVCAAIRRLDPRPGWRFGRSEAQFIVPDVVARKYKGRWVAQLNPAVVPRLRLNHTYAEMFARHRQSSTHTELATHLQEARWTLRNVEQRFSTILSVARAIMKRQYGFFDYGSLAMKPLGLREIAQEVGVHESTVCRVTNNKYIATPAGVFELKHFFSRPMPMASGKSFSATAIRSVVKELIASEESSDPMSDVDIAHRLTRQGLTVARRTVTKYRQMLQIPPVEQRRKHASG
jgi:RNA polymerase sigma-54 factor